MNMDDERQRSISAKIERLRERTKRLRRYAAQGEVIECVAIILGILDLLGDEL